MIYRLLSLLSVSFALKIIMYEQVPLGNFEVDWLIHTSDIFLSRALRDQQQVADFLIIVLDLISFAPFSVTKHKGLQHLSACNSLLKHVFLLNNIESWIMLMLADSLGI